MVWLRVVNGAPHGVVVGRLHPETGGATTRSITCWTASSPSDQTARHPFDPPTKLLCAYTGREKEASRAR